MDWLGLGASIVDSLDTLYIMGLREEFQEAADQWSSGRLQQGSRFVVLLFFVCSFVLPCLLLDPYLSLCLRLFAFPLPGHRSNETNACECRTSKFCV